MVLCDAAHRDLHHKEEYHREFSQDFHGPSHLDEVKSNLVSDFNSEEISELSQHKILVIPDIVQFL